MSIGQRIAWIVLIVSSVLLATVGGSYRWEGLTAFFLGVVLWDWRKRRTKGLPYWSTWRGGFMAAFGVVFLVAFAIDQLLLIAFFGGLFGLARNRLEERDKRLERSI